MKLNLNTKYLITCTVSVLSSFIFTVQANAQFIQADKLIAGSDMTFFPYEYLDNNTPAGFDIEFMDGVATQMGKSVEHLDTRWANLIPGLRGGRFDIVNSSMYITEERLKVIDMIPYLKSGVSILSLKNNNYQPKTPEEFCGHKIGAMAGTSWLQKLQKLSTDYCVKNKLQPMVISEYATDPQTTQALLSHAVDAQITDAAVGKGVVSKLNDRIIISSEKILYPVINGIGVTKTNKEVKEALIAAIAKYRNTPEYKALLQKYNFTEPTEEDLKTLIPKL